jgi:hypothetical protein
MPRSSWLPRTAFGWVAFGALAVLFALAGYALLGYTIGRDPGADVAAYWGAAERLRSGEQLYVANAPNAPDLYRYAPWFAYLWIPVTLLPREAVTVAWVGLMLLAALASTLPLGRSGPAGLAAVALFAPLQLQGAVFGNVQPLLVLALMWGVDRRSGPLWIALGASLKGVPLLLVLVYAARGEWRRVGWVVALTASLVLPALFWDLSGYSTDPGPGQASLLTVSPLLFGVVAAGGIGLAVIVARSEPGRRHAWLAASAAMIATLPRLLSYEIGFLLVGLARRDRR